MHSVQVFDIHSANNFKILQTHDVAWHLDWYLTSKGHSGNHSHYMECVQSNHSPNTVVKVFSHMLNMDMFRLLKDVSGRNLYSWAVLRIWCQNGNNVHLDTNLGNNAFISILLIYAWLHTSKTTHLFIKGMKKYSHILSVKWPIVVPQYCVFKQLWWFWQFCVISQFWG